MRAVRIDRFGGPEVLELVELPDPEPTGNAVICAVTSAGVKLRRHPPDRGHLPVQDHLPLVRAARWWGACRTAGGSRRSPFPAGTPRRPSRCRPQPSTCPTRSPTRRPWRSWSRGSPPGACCAPARAWRPASRWSCTPRPGGVGTLAVQLAKRWGAGRVIGVASSVDKRASAEALGAGMASRTPTPPIEPGSLMSRSRAVIGFWLAHCFSRPAMMAPPMAELLDCTA